MSDEEQDRPDVHETANRESHPNASGPAGLAGDMGLSSERQGPFEGIEGTGSLASAQETTDGESPAVVPDDAEADSATDVPDKPDQTSPVTNVDRTVRRGAAGPRAEQAPVRPQQEPAPLTMGFVVVPAAYVFLLRPAPMPGGREVLLQLRRGTGYMDEHWAAAVAGHVEKGESVFDAARREAAEELGVSEVELEPWCAMQRTGQGDPVDERVGPTSSPRHVVDRNPLHPRAPEVCGPAVVQPGHAAHARRTA